MKQLLLFLLCSGVFGINAIRQSALCETKTVTVITDQLDYPPGSTVNITGTGFQFGETVLLQVINEGVEGDNATDQANHPFNAVADSNGNIHAIWVIPMEGDRLGATLFLRLTAVGTSSGNSAECTFTDVPPNIASLR